MYFIPVLYIFINEVEAAVAEGLRHFYLSLVVAKLRFDFHAICDKDCQFPVAGRRWPPVSSANKTYRHEIIYMVLYKV